MISMIIKYLWAQRRSNALLFAELIIVGVFLFFILDISTAAYRKYANPSGFNVEQCYVLRIGLNNPDSANAVEIKNQLDSYLAGRDEVENVASTFHSEPYSGSSNSLPIIINGVSYQMEIKEGDEQLASILQIPIVEGRWFTSSEMYQKKNICVISKTLKEMLGDKGNVGCYIDRGFNMGGECQIVGVVGDTKGSTFELVRPILYVPLNIDGLKYGWRSIVKIRKSAEDNFAATLQYINNDLSKSLGFSLSEAKSFDQMRETIDADQINSISGIFWCVIFFLVNIFLGIYIVFAGRMKKRFQEIGLRMAVGSSRRDIIKLIAGESILLLVFSSLIVLIVVVNLAYFGYLEPSFPVTFWRVAGVFIFTEFILLVSVLSSVLIPALKASKVNPAVALHYE